MRNFTELHRLPLLEIGPENSFNYPPSNSQNFIDYPPPPRNWAGKLKTPSTTPPPRIHRTSYRLPPPSEEIGPENSFNYPPSNSRNFIDYLFRLRSWWNALERCLESVPTVKNSHFNHCIYDLLFDFYEQYFSSSYRFRDIRLQSL